MCFSLIDLVMKKHKIGSGLIVAIICCILLPLACSEEVDTYKADNYYPNEFIDSLMVDIVTFMGGKPRSADYLTRHDEIHRPHFVEQSRDFHIDRLFIDDDGTHYYYIIRPARHPLGNQRAVGGKFMLDENDKINVFEETFVTQVMDEKELKELGASLFEKLISGDEHLFLNNRQIIEWPDDRCLYDREKNEWRYDVVTAG